MIDVHDPTLNPILNACFFLILGLALLSILPWRLNTGKNRWTALIPFLSIFLYIVYERAMPSFYETRFDLFLLVPALALTVFIGFVRIIVVLQHRKRSKEQD